VGSLMSKIAFPALTDLSIEGAPVELVSFYPAELPDLFVGEELVVFGRYRGTGTGPLTVTGQRQGRTERFRVSASFEESEFDNAFIPRLWASRRIGDLTRTIRLEGASEELIEEIRDLGLRHGILTEYTSYLVLEPGMDGTPMPTEELMERNRRDGAFAPAAAQTGSGAFRAAEASADMAQAKSLDDADRRAARSTSELLGRSTNLRSRTLSGRIFVERDGVWTDAAHRAGVEVVTVAPFSEAYFDLVTALPELLPYLVGGEDVLIAGKKITIGVAGDGVTRLTPDRIDTIARQYRGP